MNLNQYIRIVPDFPKKGVSYKDITPLLKDPKAMVYCLDALTEPFENMKIDKVVGIEARGFLLGPLLASRLNAGFVPIRKKGKLPAETIYEEYALEYGKDRLEIHIDAIKPGEKVILHDDVLATGGTALAACNLIERLGGEVVQCNFLIELTFLQGIKKLDRFKINSLLQY